jgi:hypothetical protein
MSLARTWLDLLPTIREGGLVDLDGIIRPDAPPPAAPSFSFTDPAAPPPSSQLWPWSSADYSCIGIRVTHPLPAVAPIALRLASAAVERHVVPIILTTLPVSGFERFGFRTERLYGSTPEALAACEAELMRFWNIAIVIDAADAALLS